MKHRFVALLGAALLFPSSASAERLSVLPAPPGVVVAQSEFSDTTVATDGRLHTQIAPYPINFKNETGDWESIDTSLVSAGGGDLRPASLEGDAVIPPTLAEPVTLEHEGRQIEFQLRGAAGTRSQSDTRATFTGALPNVDAVYEARSLGVKETLVLRSPQASRVFTYDLRVDSGLTAIVRSGAILVVDSTGKERFRIDAPAAWDSATPASFTDSIDLDLEQVGAGEWVITVTPDPTWLNSPARVYPVSVDPDYYWTSAPVMRFHGATDCALENGNFVNVSFCGSTILRATRKGSSVSKPIFKFDVNAAIPSDADVTKARFFAYSPGTVARFDHDMRLRTVTADWDSNATWNERKAGVAWTTPGGDVSSDPLLTGPPDAVGYAGYYYGWDAPASAVQQWVAGTLPNYGFQLDPDVYANPNDPNHSNYAFTSTENSQTTQWPLLDVTWTSPTVDTLPPDPPGEVSPGELDEVAGTVVVRFKAGEDREFSSGVAGVEVRTQIGNGTWSTWTTQSSPMTIGGLVEGQQVRMELRTRDNAGHRSSVSVRGFEAAGPPSEEIFRQGAAAYYASEYNTSTSIAQAWLTRNRRLTISTLRSWPTGTRAIATLECGSTTPVVGSS